MNRDARNQQIGRLRGIAESLESGYGLGESMSPRALAVHIRQAANELEALAPCRELVEDIAIMGLRTDMHPTVAWQSGDEVTMYSRLCKYFQGAEDNLKERAKEAMNGD